MTLSKQRSHDSFPKSQHISPCMLAIFQLGKLPSASLNPPCGFNWIQASSLSCRNCCAGLLCTVKQLLSEVGDRMDPEGQHCTGAGAPPAASGGHTCPKMCPDHRAAPKGSVPGLSPLFYPLGLAEPRLANTGMDFAAFSSTSAAWPSTSCWSIDGLMHLENTCSSHRRVEAQDPSPPHVFAE